MGGGGTDIIEVAHPDTRVRPVVAVHADVPAVQRVADEPMGLTVVGLAALLAACSAVLAVALVERWMPGGAWISGLFAMGVLAWLVAAWWLSHGTGRPLVVLRRGCLLGLFQWLAVALQFEPVASAGTGTGPAAGATVGLADGWITQSVAVHMVWISLAGLLCLSWLTWSKRRAAPRQA